MSFYGWKLVGSKLLCITKEPIEYGKYLGGLFAFYFYNE